jgi:hypothetical protein
MTGYGNVTTGGDDACRVMGDDGRRPVIAGNGRHGQATSGVRWVILRGKGASRSDMAVNDRIRVQPINVPDGSEDTRFYDTK